MSGTAIDSRQTRVARGLVASSTSTLIAAVSHAAGGGSFPHPLLLLFGVVFGSLFCVGLAGRRVSTFRLVPAVLASQLLLHFLFSIAPTAPLRQGSAHHAHSTVIVVGAATGSPVTIDGGMFSAHLFAAAITVLALRFGEAAFWGLFDTARLALHRVLRGSAPTSAELPLHRPRPVPEHAVILVDSAHLSTSLRRRGPPRAAF